MLEKEKEKENSIKIKYKVNRETIIITIIIKTTKIIIKIINTRKKKNVMHIVKRKTDKKMK